MKTIHVNASKSYDILIERGVLERAGEEIKTVCGAGEALIVSDDTVWDLYGETVLASMQKAGFDVTSFTFPHGEQSKNLSVYADILNALAARHLSRKGLVVALGGGVVGDMAGFAAATYLRGVRFVQIPTTLLSQVDSSVGGKTAVDLPAGKNLVGAFCQPSLVLCDPHALSTLPDPVFYDGCAEVIKAAMLKSHAFFEDLQKTPPREQLDEARCRGGRRIRHRRAPVFKPRAHVRSRGGSRQRVFHQPRLRGRHRHGHDDARRSEERLLQRRYP